LAEEAVTVTTGLDTVRKSSVQRGNRIGQKLTGLSLKGLMCVQCSKKLCKKVQFCVCISAYPQ